MDHSGKKMTENGQIPISAKDLGGGTILAQTSLNLADY
jgi:hypothetical protein